MPSLPATGRTALYDASVAAGNLFKVRDLSGGGVHTGTPVDGEAIQIWDDAVGDLNQCLQFNNTGPKFRSVTPLLPFPCLDWTLTTDQLISRNQAANANRALSNYISAGACTALISFRLATDPPNNATVYQNMTLLGDLGQYLGIYLKKPAGYTAHFYNWDGTADDVSVAINKNQNHVLMVRHESGNLYISVDGGSESSVASGNTQDLTSPVGVGFRATGTETPFNGRIGEIAIYNVALTGTDLSDAIAYFYDKWILGLGPGGAGRFSPFLTGF